MARELQRVSPDDLDRAHAAMEADGAVIVEGIVAPDLLARLNAELDALVEAAPPGSRSDSPVWQTFHGANTKRFTRLAGRVPSYPELLRTPVMRAVADRLLLPSCGRYWLTSGQMMVIGPGEPTQWLHRDQENWPLLGRVFGATGPEITTSTMFALTDFTEEVGATRVIPGSHRWDDWSRVPSPEETVGAVMSAGDALLYTGKVVHGAGHNETTDRWRRGLFVGFVLGWLVPEDAGPLATPWEVARDLPEDVQQLLGWASYDPAPHGGRLWTVDFEDMRTTLLPALD